MSDEERDVTQASSMSDERRAQLHRVGIGNWEAFRAARLSVDDLLNAAAEWADKLQGVERPWLCWNIDSDWCLVQQQLVRHVGWTPVVGYDPRVGPPRRTIAGAIVIDFNRSLRWPLLYPHVPIELVFKFADRLAFWHSDLLMRLPLLERIARDFEQLPDGSTYVTDAHQSLWHRVRRRYRRYWELIGCTTRAASQSQFESGAGWWWHFAEHPNCPDEHERRRRLRYYWDHGAGIYYWAHHCGGNVRILRSAAIHEGHCTGIKNTQFIDDLASNSAAVERVRKSQLSRNFNLDEVCTRLDIAAVRTER